MLRSLTLVGVLIAAGPVATLAQAAPPAAVARAPQKVVTQHAGRFNGQAVSYKAIVAEDFVPGATGTPAASIVTTAYVRTDVKDQAERPVLFLFNGGPGASTTPLHFGAFGPYKREGEEGAQRMVDNPDSILDATDLVFIDPVGTGYSRPLRRASRGSRSGAAPAMRPR
jgi:carboxypeptidase C (cathepsin A)